MASTTARLSGFEGRQIDLPTGLFIDSTFVPSVENATLEILNPSTGKHLVTIASATAKDVDLAVASSLKAYNTPWKQIAPSERRRLLLKLADLMERDIDVLSSLEALDVGMLYSAGQTFTVPTAIEWLRYFAGWADKVDGRSTAVATASATLGLGYTRKEPYGVTAAIVPWNSPLLLACWKIGPSLAAGNTLILKPAELAPLSLVHIASLVKEAGFPPGVVNVVPGLGHIAGAALAAHMDVRKIAFTGSALVGRTILSASAASNLKKVSLELGGKSPSIVFNDADVDQAAFWTTLGITSAEGQVCLAGSRIYVQEGVYESFCKKFADAAQHAALNDPLLADTIKGPIISEKQLERVMSLIAQGKSEAELLFGGTRVGNGVQNTAFRNVPEDASIMKEEIFGPVASIASFRTEDEVVAKANNTEHGLSAAIFTNNLNLAHRVAASLESGQVTINAWGMLAANLPFGGHKQSGFGREGGPEALDEWTTSKSIKIFIPGLH